MNLWNNTRSCKKVNKRTLKGLAGDLVGEVKPEIKQHKKFHGARGAKSNSVRGEMSVDLNANAHKISLIIIKNNKKRLSDQPINRRNIHILPKQS
jgi:hypothetical protein